LEPDEVPIVVFNHPYYPSPLNLYNTLTPEGGKVIISRFLAEASLRVGQKGCIVMPYSEIAGDANNPLYLAHNHNLTFEMVNPPFDSSEDHILVLAMKKDSG
jgi:hypothetical protein